MMGHRSSKVSTPTWRSTVFPSNKEDRGKKERSWRKCRRARQSQTSIVREGKHRCPIKSARSPTLPATFVSRARPSASFPQLPSSFFSLHVTKIITRARRTCTIIDETTNPSRDDTAYTLIIIIIMINRVTDLNNFDSIFGDERK